MINYLQVNFCCSVVLSMFPCVETFCMSKFCVRNFLLHFTSFLTFLVQSSLVLHFHIVVKWTFVSLCHFFACWSFVVLKFFPFSFRACPFFFCNEEGYCFFNLPLQWSSICVEMLNLSFLCTIFLACQSYI